MPSAPRAGAPAHAVIPSHDITGLVLAGGRGSRMGGVDKGLQPFHGIPLALHAVRRLQPQVGPLLLSANRHAAQYAAWDAAPVLADGVADFAGPLAGFLAGLQHCHTGWLLTVPCDTPLFPSDLARRLAVAAQAAGTDVAVAAAPDADAHGGAPVLRRQPVFCLLRSTLQADLAGYLAGGGRKIGAWLARHPCAVAAFDQPGDLPQAFANANTLAELQALENSRLP